MKPYTVIYDDKIGMPWEFFECLADDADHAEEQCLDAYPKCIVLWINEGHGEQSRRMEGDIA